MMDRSDDETRLLTYPEIAQAFAMTVASARNLASKRRWRKLPANSGDRKTVRVLVPVDELPAAPPPRRRRMMLHRSNIIGRPVMHSRWACCKVFPAGR